MKSATDLFAQKKFSKDIFKSEICYSFDYLVTGPGIVTIQGVVVLVISNRPHASCLSDFEINRYYSLNRQVSNCARTKEQSRGSGE